MKKFLTALFGVLIVCASALGFTACGNGGGSIQVYVPDGAPALAIAQLMAEDMQFGKDVDYNVVDADGITSNVTYDDMSKNADLCVLPVNDASKLLGNGAKYKMLGAVTHGNLYIVSATDKAVLTADNFAEEISGKKLGVVQMAKFPGAITKVILSKYSVTESVDLQAVQPTEVTGVGSDFDYFVIPEPSASTRLGNANLSLKLAGSLQELYGGANGYPQAVLVAKNSLIESDPEFISDFIAAVAASSQWLLKDEVTSETILNAIRSHYPDPENTAPAFNNLSKSVIANCAVNFTAAADCKAEVKTFLTKLKAVNPDFAAEVADNFFYTNA
jgi:NitT/TauT family transport system substrate-binding protein